MIKSQSSMKRDGNHDGNMLTLDKVVNKLNIRLNKFCDTVRNCVAKSSIFHFRFKAWFFTIVRSFLINDINVCVWFTLVTRRNFSIFSSLCVYFCIRHGISLAAWESFSRYQPAKSSFRIFREDRRHLFALVGANSARGCVCLSRFYFHEVVERIVLPITRYSIMPLSRRRLYPR